MNRMETAIHPYSQQYEEKFDPIEYLTLIGLFDPEIKVPVGTEGGEVLLVHEYMKSGCLHGKDLLEVGCGPSVLFSIIPSQYFDNVYLADYLERNLKIIKMWLEDKPEQINFQPFFDFAGKQLGKGDFWPEGPDELRKKICGVFECDIHLPEVLPPGIKPRTFDCVTSSFVLHAACSTDEELNNAVSNLASLLNPGGCLLIYGVYEATQFNIKGIELPELYLSSSNLSTALSKAGLSQIYKQCIDFQPDKSNSDAKQYGLYVAKKN